LVFFFIKGKLLLKSSKTHADMFEQGNEDVFDLRAIDVGEVRKIKIGHDGSGFGAGKLKLHAKCYFKILRAKQIFHNHLKQFSIINFSYLQSTFKYFLFFFKFK